MFQLFENKESLDKKLVDFLAKCPFFSLLPPYFFWKDARSFTHHVTPCFLYPHLRTRECTPPAHRALSELAILAFTLYLHPQFIDSVCFAREGNALFQLSPVKEIKVTLSPANRCFIVPYLRMVKRWRQKTKNSGRRATRARWGLRWEADALSKKKASGSGRHRRCRMSWKYEEVIKRWRNSLGLIFSNFVKGRLCS